MLDEPLDALKARFRRLRAPAATPASWGSFAVVASRGRPWGHEAVVSNFDDERLLGLLDGRGERSVEVGGMTLEEIFLAVCDQKGGHP